MKRKQMTDKEMMYMIIGKITVKLMQYVLVGVIFAGFIIAGFNSMTVYR